MRGVIIAAGRGERMGRLTDERPKCLLPVGGRALLEHTVENLRAAGCDEVVVVVGYRAERIRLPGIRTVKNPDFERNNILHSLLSARAWLEGPVLVSYSDIWVEPWIHRRLVETPGDLVLAVDSDWRPYYEGRRHHPTSEAETVHVDPGGAAVAIGKQLGPDPPAPLRCGEFLGVWRMSRQGTARFVALFDELDAWLGPEDPFQRAAHWRRAYVTDLIQESLDRGQPVRTAPVERGWAELDTAEDYERLPRVARRQRLWTLCGGAPA